MGKTTVVRNYDWKGTGIMGNKLTYLGSPADYPILKAGHGLSLQSWDDREEFGKVTAAMKVRNWVKIHGTVNFDM